MKVYLIAEPLLKYNSTFSKIIWTYLLFNSSPKVLIHKNRAIISASFKAEFIDPFLRNACRDIRICDNVFNFSAMCHSFVANTRICKIIQTRRATDAKSFVRVVDAVKCHDEKCIQFTYGYYRCNVSADDETEACCFRKRYIN